MSDEPWPLRCVHVERCNLPPFAVLTKLELRNVRPIPPGERETDADITLCPYCTGVLIGEVIRLFRDGPGAVREMSPKSWQAECRAHRETLFKIAAALGMYAEREPDGCMLMPCGDDLVAELKEQLAKREDPA